MKAIILGAGRVGYGIARYLSLEDNDISIVDLDPEILKRVSDKLDVQPVFGFASHPDVLKQAGADDADLLIAVTGSDEVNMIACEVAQSLFHVETKIARVRHQSYLKPHWSGMFSSKRLAVDVIISPEFEVACSLDRSTRISGAFDVITFADDMIKVIGVRCILQSTLVNTPIKFLSTVLPDQDLVIVCIRRGEQTLLPNKEEILNDGDEVYFLGRSEDIPSLMGAFGYQETEGRSMIVVGGGGIGRMFSAQLEQNQPDVKIKLIEKNYERSESAAKFLKTTEVLHGDALDLEVLLEANVSSSETVVSVTQDDKVNILSALLAKRSGARRSLALLNNMNYAPLVTSLGVDAVINPRAITISTILQHIRQGQLRSIRSIGDTSIEIIEAEARETSHVIGLNTEDIRINGTVFIAALIRGNDVYLMPERYIIGVGDRLILACRKEAIRKVEKLFSIRPSYL